MKLLLDTHVIIWTLTDDIRLSERARDLIKAADNIVCFSSVSLWEIALKNQKAPDKCPYNEREILNYCKKAGFASISILPEHILGIRELKIKEDRYISNQDHFDRLLIAQAKAENCYILSHDKNFMNYDDVCIYPI